MGKKKKKARKSKKKKETIWYKHKDVRRSNKKLHRHPSHPYPHPKGRWHKYPPTSRIKDRKGKKFRHTPEEHRRTRVKTKYRERGAKKKRRWD